MKKQAAVLFWMLFAYNLFADGSGEIAYRDRKIDVSFPKEIAGMSFRNLEEYDDPKAGYSLRYSVREIKADIYVYDHGIPNIPNGYSSKIVKSEAASISRILKTMEERGYYKNLRHLGKGIVPKQGQIRFVWNKFEFFQVSQDGVPETKKRTSIAFVTGFAGKFIKIRLTYMKNDAKTGKKVSGQFIKKLVQILTKANNTLENNKVLVAIKTFKKNPLDDEGDIAMKNIVDFAESSEDITVTIDAKYCPWINEGENKNDHILLAAFIAGNIESQLEKSEQNNCTYDGILQEISTYKYLRKKKAIEQIKSLENWIKLQQSGSLKKYIEKL